MEIQSGISSLTLFSAIDTTFERVSSTEITNISGTNIVVPNEDSPTFEKTIERINRILFFNYTFSFFVFGLQVSTSQFKNKLGWLVLLTFYNGDEYFLNTPVFMQETELNTNETNTRKIELKPNRPTGRLLKVL